MVGTETKLVLHISIVKGFVHNPLHTWMAIVFKCPAAAATSKDVFFGGVIRDVETSHGFCIKSAPIIRSNWEYFHDKKFFENVVSWTFYSAAHKHVCRLLAQFLYCPFLLRNVALFWLSQPSETTFHFRFWEGQKPSDTACEWTCATGLACLSTNRSSFVNRGWAHTCRVRKLVGARWELPPKKSLNIMKVVANCVERYNNEREGCLKRGCLLNEIKQSTNAAGEAAIVQLLFFVIFDHVHVHNDGLKGAGPRTAHGPFPWQLDATKCSAVGRVELKPTVMHVFRGFCGWMKHGATIPCK